MTFFAPALAAALLLSSPLAAVAQTPPAAASAPSPQSLALGQRLADLYGHGAPEAFGETLRKAVVSNFSEDPIRADKAKGLAEPFVQAVVQATRGKLGELYAQNLTPADLRAAVAFFESGTGRAVLTHKTYITEQGLASARAALPQITAAIGRAVCERQGCADAGRAHFVAFLNQVAQTPVAPPEPPPGKLASNAGKRATALQVLQADGVGDGLKQVTAGMQQGLAKLGLEDQDAQVRQDLEPKLAPVIADAFAATTPKLTDEMATLYAELFTEAQLKTMLHFYRSDAGQALLKASASVAGQIKDFKASQGTELQHKLTPVLCQNGLCQAPAAVKAGS